MDPLEQEYLANVERANARDRRREQIVSALTSGLFGRATILSWGLDELERRVGSADDSTSVERQRGYREAGVAVAAQRRRSRYRRAVRVAFWACGIALMGWDSVYGPRSYTADRARCLMFVLLFGALLWAAQYVWGIWRARRNARLQLEWERRFDSDSSARMP